MVGDVFTSCRYERTVYKIGVLYTVYIKFRSDDIYTLILTLFQIISMICSNLTNLKTGRDQAWLFQLGFHISKIQAKTLTIVMGKHQVIDGWLHPILLVLRATSRICYRALSRLRRLV